MLAHRFAVYVPGTVNVNRPAPGLQASVAEGVAGLFAARFGGCTIVDGIGCWIGPDDSLIREPVKIVFAYTDDATAAALWTAGVAASVADRMGQASVAYETPQGMDFATPINSARKASA